MTVSANNVIVPAAAEDEHAEQQMLSCGALEVPSPHHQHRVYRIQPSGVQVQVHEHGQHTLDLRLQPTGMLPADKAFTLVIKGLIEGNEEAYLALATPSMIRAPLELRNMRWGVGRPSGRARLAMARSEWF